VKIAALKRWRPLWEAVVVAAAVAAVTEQVRFIDHV